MGRSGGRPRAAEGGATGDVERAGGAASPRSRPQSKLTGRAAVLVLVLAVLTVSYASSMRAYLQQRSSINELKSQIAGNNADISKLAGEKKQWDDPAYVQQQARARLGYVMPGDTTYLVLDQDGKPLDVQASLDDASSVATTQQAAWWSDEWDSVELAGHPPKVSGKGPATKIDGSQKSGSQNSGG